MVGTIKPSQLEALFKRCYDGRLNLEFSWRGQLEIKIAQRATLRTRSKKISEVFSQTEAYFDPKPLPALAAIDFPVIADYLNLLLKNETLFDFGADYRKTGKGKVFSTRIVPKGTPWWKVQPVRSNDALSCLSEAAFKAGLSL